MDLSAVESVLSGQSRWAVVQGDCVEAMNLLPADCVNLAFGSPPYVDCRMYLENGADMGIARETEEWCAWMRTVFAACLRVSVGLTGMVVEGKTASFSYDCAPYRLMADLARSGVCLRKPPVYRRSGIPGSGGPDWLRNDYETIICTTRGGQLPWSDNTACGHAPKYAPGGDCTHRNAAGVRKTITVRRPNGECRRQTYNGPALANPGNVIDCKVGGGLLGSNLAHDNEAPFPERLAEFFVLSFCPPGGIVLDPFAGSGTTLAAAVKHGRRAIGFDVRPSQVALTTRRLSGVTPGLFGERQEYSDAAGG